MSFPSLGLKYCKVHVNKNEQNQLLWNTTFLHHLQENWVFSKKNPKTFSRKPLLIIVIAISKDLQTHLSAQHQKHREAAT